MSGHSAEAIAAYPDEYLQYGRGVYKPRSEARAIELNGRRTAFGLGWDARQAEVDALQARIDAAFGLLKLIEGADVDILNGRPVMDAEEEKAIGLRKLRAALTGEES